jgi:hypothetical protein
MTALVVRRPAPLAGMGVLIAAAALWLAGCASAPSGASGWTTVPIADFKSVAGKWEGPLTRGHGPKDDWLELTIRDDGSYEAVSSRVIGVMRGTGRFTIADGRLVAQGERGSAVAALATRGAERRLDVNMKNREGLDLPTTLVPSR